MYDSLKNSNYDQWGDGLLKNSNCISEGWSVIWMPYDFGTLETVIVLGDGLLVEDDMSHFAFQIFIAILSVAYMLRLKLNY